MNCPRGNAHDCFLVDIIKNVNASGNSFSLIYQEFINIFTTERYGVQCNLMPN